MACLKSMGFGVIAFTIFCLVYATIRICASMRLPNGKNSGGRRVSLRPPNKTRYLKGVEKLRNSIKKSYDDCESMMISKEQCQLLRSECLRLVQPHQHPQPLSFLKESFCAIRRALELMKDCCSKNWLLKAVEFGNCQRHFLEILLDLHRLPIVEDLIGSGGESYDDMATKFRSIDISKETKSKLDDAWESDKAALRSKLESVSGDDRWLADQLEPKANPLLIAPDDIGRCVTQFDILKSPIYKRPTELSPSCVFPVTFRHKEFVIKIRLSISGAVVEEDSKYTTLQTEADFMKLCRHPYAVALLGFWEAVRTDGPRAPLLLMESMECDLDSIIKGNKSWWWPWGGTGGFPALVAINLVLPVAKVMKYLHGIGVVHLDLKPKNILFTLVKGERDHPEDVSVKLADFGEARMVKDKLIANKDGIFPEVGTSGYMDPDVWAKKGSDDLFKADVFSFGMVFGEVLTGLSPVEALGCEGLHPKKFYGKLQEGKQVPLPKKTPKSVKSIVESCLKLKPDERPSFHDICGELHKAEFQLLNGCT